MKTVSVTIGSLLAFGAALVLVNCGGDDSSTGGAGATGGSGGSGATGGSGGSGGASGGSAGSGGSSGAGMPEGGTTGGTAGASGSGGKAGAGGASGSGGKAGGGGAGGSAGKDGGLGGTAGMDAGPSCPASAPQPGSACTDQLDCTYGTTVCTCIDPGPNGTWGCSGGPPPDGGSGDAGGKCPDSAPLGESCPDAGLPIGPCIYGTLSCSCPVGATDWMCENHGF